MSFSLVDHDPLATRTPGPGKTPDRIVPHFATCFNLFVGSDLTSSEYRSTPELNKAVRTGGSGIRKRYSFFNLHKDKTKSSLNNVRTNPKQCQETRLSTLNINVRTLTTHPEK